MRTHRAGRTTVSRREVLALGAAAAAAQLSRRSPAYPGKESTRMHLGLVTYNVAKDWDLPTLLRICREAGMEGVEFRTTHAHGVEPALDAARRRDVRQRCADAGLLQTSLGTVCEFHSPDPAAVRQNVATCREFVLLAHDVGARAVKVRPNGMPAGVPEQKTIEQIGRALAECGGMAEQHGVEIWMEVHGAGTMLPQNARRIMDACGNRNVGLTWNSNATDVAEGSVKTSFELLRPFIRCCHITELWSTYPYRELFTLLRHTGYDRFTLVELGASIRAEDGTPFLQCYKGLWRELSR